MTAFDRLSRVCGPVPPPDLLADLAEYADDIRAAQAAEVDRLRAELKQAVGQRDYWHGELMCADARILELGRKVPEGGAR